MVYERGTLSVKNSILKSKGLDFGAESPPLKLRVCKVHKCKVQM